MGNETCFLKGKLAFTAFPVASRIENMETAGCQDDPKIRILLVEDEPALLELLVDVFEGSGAQVFAASNGIEAMEVFERESIDFMLSDVVMPVMDGLTLCNVLFEKSEGAPIVSKVFLLTGSDGVSVPTGVNDLFSVEVVKKPFDIFSLVSRVIAIKEKQPRI